MRPLVDGDLIAYRTAATCENEMEAVNRWRIDDTLQLIYEAVSLEGNKGTIYLTGSNNFRKQLDPEYKANRRDKPKPKWLQYCREYLISKWNAEVTEGCEADDAMGCNQTVDTIICSLDKDMLMIPGRHYNWVKQEFRTVNELEALQSFWQSALIGDVSDNIKGIYGVGPVKAKRALDGLETHEDCFEAVRRMYDDDSRLLMNLDLLWIQRRQGKMWSNEFPELASLLAKGDRDPDHLNLNPHGDFL